MRDLPEMAALHNALDEHIRNRVEKLCWRIISMQSEEEVQRHLPLLKGQSGALVTLATVLARHRRLREAAGVAVRAYECRRERYDREKVRESVVGAL